MNPVSYTHLDVYKRQLEVPIKLSNSIHRPPTYTERFQRIVKFLNMMHLNADEG